MAVEVLVMNRPWAARIAALSHRRRRGTPDDQPGPSAPSGLNLCLRPSATRFTIEVASRVPDSAIVEAAAWVARGMSQVDSNDASRLLFAVERALHELVIERDLSWLLLGADALAVEAAGEPPC